MAGSVQRPAVPVCPGIHRRLGRPSTESPALRRARESEAYPYQDRTLPWSCARRFWKPPAPLTGCR